MNAFSTQDDHQNLGTQRAASASLCVPLHPVGSCYTEHTAKAAVTQKPYSKYQACSTYDVTPRLLMNVRGGKPFAGALSSCCRHFSCLGSHLLRSTWHHVSSGTTTVPWASEEPPAEAHRHLLDSGRHRRSRVAIPLRQPPKAALRRLLQEL
ncbi:hypothetical protein V5799_022981 [Amblyomma americanum]|uniref:Uncharacterized protein n=1 Tax=Amblyomma americanum TaxID=6943 RepID=A0AAQ4FIV0_AMBAM